MTTTPPHQAHIAGFAHFVPERVVTVEDLMRETGKTPDQKESFFKAPRERRYASPRYSGADLGVKALEALCQKLALDPLSVDAVIYSCAINDYINEGVGPDVAHRAGARRAISMQVDAGCSSYITMLGVARAFIESGRFQRVAVVTVTNFISRLDDYRKAPESWMLGDGAGATLLTRGESSFLSLVEETHGENYGLMLFKTTTANGEKPGYWEAGSGYLGVELQSDLDRLKTNAYGMVVNMVKRALAEAHTPIADVKCLFTHQPNEALMGKWRQGLEIGDRVFDTFQRFGNMFQASMPVTLSVASEEGIIKPGDTVALGTFSYGGDHCAATVLKL